MSRTPEPQRRYFQWLRSPCKAGRKRRFLVLACFIAVSCLAALRSAGKTAPTTEVIVHASDNIQTLVSAHPPGTTFQIDPGIYRLASIAPKTGDSFIGKPGAILSGAVLLGSYTHEGPNWVASITVTPRAINRGVCQPARPACMLPEDLFIDNAPLQRVATLAAVAPGKWFLDYSTGKVYFRDDPHGRKLEISVIPHAFSGAASHVLIRGLTIEKYADIAGDGAIQGQPRNGPLTDGWVVENNTLRWNHGMAIRVGDTMQVLNNAIIDNGQMGLGGTGDDIRVAGNDISNNNYAGYSYSWEAGGAKFLFTKNLVVQNNDVHGNDGPGLWTDTDNVGTLYEGNRTRGNREAGILHEISHQAVIRDNTIENDGYDDSGRTSPWYGAGILISTSDGVDVYGNTVVGCMNGIIGLQADRKMRAGGSYLLKNLYVHDNTVVQAKGIAAGIIRSSSFDDSVFQTWHNRFAQNTFHLGPTGGKYFSWMNSLLTVSQWQNDPHGQSVAESIVEH